MLAICELLTGVRFMRPPPSASDLRAPSTDRGLDRLPFHRTARSRHRTVLLASVLRRLRAFSMSSKRRRLISNLSVSTKLTRLFQRRSEEHTSELQSLMRISYAVFCLKKKT